jgi:transposase
VVLGGYFATLARMRKPYPTDLSDAEWKYIEAHLPAPNGFGRPRTHSLREILNAVFYLLKSGCQWRLLRLKGFVVLPRRWVVERTIAWIDQNRRMSKDYERLCASGEALVYAAMIRLMTRRLARA